MSQVIAEILAWADTLPFWQQAALDMVIGGKAIEEDDYRNLEQFLLEDAGIAKHSPRPVLAHLQKGNAKAPTPSSPLQLVRVFDLTGVNALVESQSLWFGPQLTAIFGANGSGKSGYSRVLASSAFTRGDSAILPNIATKYDPNQKATVKIEVANGSPRIINHVIGTRCDELSSFYVFDSTSVVAHLTSSHAFSFSPAGLATLARLAVVTDEVRERLRLNVERLQRPHNLTPHFVGESSIRTAILALDHSTNTKDIEKWAIWTSEDEQLLTGLDLEIAKLKALNTPKEIAQLEKLQSALFELRSTLELMFSSLGSEKERAISNAIKHRNESAEVAKTVGVDQFKASNFRAIGTDQWFAFIKAARILAERESEGHNDYPGSDSVCLLCQQPLTVAASALLQKLWAFLDAEAQTQLNLAEASLVSMSAELGHVSTVLMSADSLAASAIHDSAPSLEKTLGEISAVALKRKEAFILRLKGDVVMDVTSLPELPAPELQALIDRVAGRVELLKQSDPSARIAKLNGDLTLLTHRQTLSKILPEVTAYIARRVWAEKARKLRGDTRGITQKHNELFKKLVTDKYVELFIQTLTDLDCPMSVEIATKGKKGETLMQLVVKTDPSIPNGFAKIDAVLSEGEKRAIALADFLTEVGVDESSAGIILDDPVTSLDFDWKETIAPRLAEESKKRQVIIFTHDLHFLYLLGRSATQSGVELASHWIQRGEDGRPGYVFRDNCPSMEREYKSSKRPKMIYDQAKLAAGEVEERLLREGFGALRTCYEAFVIFDLFGEVVMRFEERVSIGRLKDVVIDQPICTEIDEAVSRLSRFIEGHLHSDVTSSKKPTCDDLNREIASFDELKSRQKKLKAGVA